jgi:hypothetical protein
MAHSSRRRASVILLPLTAATICAIAVASVPDAASAGPTPQKLVVIHHRRCTDYCSGAPNYSRWRADTRQRLVHDAAYPHLNTVTCAGARRSALTFHTGTG